MFLLVFGVIYAFTITGGSELCQVFDPADYFKSRGIEVKAETLIDLAKKEPKTPVDSVRQLFAIRLLGEHKEAKARDTLQQIAQGKIAQDTTGFAKEYAQVALLRLDGKPVPVAAMPQGSLRDALAWFPDDTTLFGAMDMRLPPPLRNLVVASMDVDLKKDLTKAYNDLERFGNVRLERIAFAYHEDPTDKKKAKTYLRFTARGESRWLAEYLHKELGGNDQKAKLEETKDSKGEKLLLWSNGPFAIAFLGNSELVFAGFEDEAGGNGLEQVNQVLAIRDGKKASLLNSVYANHIKAVPADAFAMLLGQVPVESRKDSKPDSPWGYLASMSLHVKAGDHVSLRFTGTTNKPADAKTVAKLFEDEKDKARAELKALPAGIVLTPEQLALLNKAIDSVKITPKDSVVEVEADVPVAVFELMQKLSEARKKQEKREAFSREP